MDIRMGRTMALDIMLDESILEFEDSFSHVYVDTVTLRLAFSRYSGQITKNLVLLRRKCYL